MATKWSSTDVFEQTIYTIVQQLLTENCEIFNANSNGAIRMSHSSILGEFERMMNLRAGSANSVKPRNPYSEDAVQSRRFERVEDNIIKTLWYFDPYKWTGTEFNMVKQNVDEATGIIARKWAQDLLKVNAQYSLAALHTVISGDNRLVKTVPSNGLITHAALVDGLRAMGDQYGDIELFVMSSKHYFDLLQTTFANAERLFQFGNVAIHQTATGQRFLITDVEGLVDSTGKKHSALGLKRGAITISTGENYDSVLEKKGSEQNIFWTMQAQCDGSMNIMNHRFKNPKSIYASNGTLDLAKITSLANWEKVDDNVKLQPGVCVTTTTA